MIALWDSTVGVNAYEQDAVRSPQPVESSSEREGNMEEEEEEL